MTARFDTILPANSSLLESAVEQTSGERWATVDVDLIRKFKDPWACPSNLLNFLAFERSVDIWDEGWDELKKRSVIASAPADHRIKGTLAGIRKYLQIGEASLVEHKAPPEGFYAGEDLTLVEWDAYLSLHPKVRLTLFRGHGAWVDPEDFFADECFADWDTTGIPQADRALYGRKAYLVGADGESDPLDTYVLTRQSETGEAQSVERITTPGEQRDAIFADHMFEGDGVVGGYDLEPAFYSFVVDRSDTIDTSFGAIGTVPVGFDPRTFRFARESEAGQGGEGLFAGDFADQYFVTIDDAAFLIGDVIRLHDPSVAVPQTAGLSFADHSRVGIAAHTAELLVDWRDTIDVTAEFSSDHSYADLDFIPAHETARRDFLLDAVASSKRLSDKIGVTFQTHRTPTLGDGIKLNGSTRLGDPVRNSL